jgi:hypothetical protein
MTPAEARKRIAALTTEVAANPARAAELAPEIAELGRAIQASPASQLDPASADEGLQVCVAHDKKICKRHQICNAHPKGVIQ